MRSIYVYCAVYYSNHVVDHTLFYNVTAFNGFIINQEHDAIPVLICCETIKCSEINCLSISNNYGIPCAKFQITFNVLDFINRT